MNYTSVNESSPVSTTQCRWQTRSAACCSRLILDAKPHCRRAYSTDLHALGGRLSTGSGAPQHQHAQGPGLVRELGLADGISLVAGTIIGSGIFLVPSAVAGKLNSLLAVVLLWIVGAVLSIFGALSLGELGAAFPKAGGVYVYLMKAFGPSVGFVYGWASLVAIESGSIATLAAAFGIYLGQFLALSPVAQKGASVACVALLTSVNCLGLKSGKVVQNIFTTCKVGGLGIMTLLLLWHGHGQLLTQNLWPQQMRLELSPFGIALIAALWAYQGWHSVAYVASEFRDPRCDLPRSLLLGTLVVAAAYLLANFGYYAVLSPAEIQGSNRLAATALAHAMGPAAGSVISLLIVVSIFGATNGTALTAARMYYAMAEDGLFFERMARVHPRFHTPVWALIMQGAWACVLALMGTFQQLFTYVIFTGWIFYGMAVAAVIVLRRREPDLERPYKVPGYPWIPLVFVLAALGLTANTIAADFLHSMMGIGMIVLGLPVYFAFARAARA